MTRWQYYVLSMEIEPEEGFVWLDERFKGHDLGSILDELGSEGWELATSTAPAFSVDGERPGVTTALEYIFKRPVLK